MQTFARRPGLFLLLATLVAATSLLAGVPGVTEPAAATPAAAQMERPAWHALPLVDAATGQPFTLADFAGKTVYVEPMATWCTNCRQQMSVIRDELRAQLDPEQVVFVGLSVETTLPTETLAAYTATHGFDWTFAVMTPELLQELATTFGRTVTNPPAVPHFVIWPDGTTSSLSTGFHSADQLFAELSAAGNMAQP
jgi:cytochrome oxidase Cu insertion factor (SCO1/SenC/PrrC family)